MAILQKTSYNCTCTFNDNANKDVVQIIDKHLLQCLPLVLNSSLAYVLNPDPKSVFTLFEIICLKNVEKVIKVSENDYFDLTLIRFLPGFLRYVLLSLFLP